MNNVTAPAVAREFVVICTECRSRFRVRQKHVGKRAACPCCGAAITISEPTAPRMSAARVAPPATATSPTPVANHTLPKKQVAAAADQPLATWQYVVGIALCAVVPFPFLIWSLMGAVMLRAAYSLCVGQNSGPRFARAWWISLLVSLASIPLMVVNLLISAAVPDLALVIGILALAAAGALFGTVYKFTLGVTFGKGVQLWLVQLLILLPIYIVVIVVLSFAVSV